MKQTWKAAPNLETHNPVVTAFCIYSLNYAINVKIRKAHAVKCSIRDCNNNNNNNNHYTNDNDNDEKAVVACINCLPEHHKSWYRDPNIVSQVSR